MWRPDSRLVLALLAAGAVSFAARLAVSWVAGLLPCQDHGVLLLPLIAFYPNAKFEAWRYVGFYPYKDLRAFLVMFVPPALTVLVQYLILRLVVPPTPERSR